MTDVAAFMKKFGVAKDEIWPVPGGNAHAIKHSALERIAAEQGIIFAPPQIIEANGADKIYSMIVTGKLGDRTEWATGEASPHNYRTTEKMAPYPLAMAEKRAKDRVILKLLAAHGVVYSEEEADDFKAAAPPPVTQDNSVQHQGFDNPPSKIKPPGWDDIIKIVDSVKNWSDYQYQTSQPFFKNTTSGWSNYYIRKLATDHMLKKVAEFRGSEVAIEMQQRIFDKFPLDRTTLPDAAE